MNLRQLQFFLSHLILAQFLLALPVCAMDWPDTPTDTRNELPFNFTNTKILHLRDPNLGNPQAVEIGSKISIDPKFLLEHLGTETPSQEQVQRMLLNPGEISKDRVVTQRFKDSYTGKPTNDYFFPVTVESKSGKVKSGKMALHAYNRNGMVELKRADGTDVSQYQSPEITANMKLLIDQNKAGTEAQAGCGDCTGQTPPPTQALAAVARSLDAAAKSSANPLFEKFQNFAREFATANKRISRSRGGHYKRLYIKAMIEKFGEKDAGTILAALTGFGEAPYRSSSATQIAEIAAVLKVIDNRAENKFRTRSRTLRDIGISENADARLTTTLSDWQFSAWNDTDNNLRRILNFNPDTADSMTKRAIALSFEAQSLMQQGKVEFIGKMNDSKLHHYHANYVNPNWNKANKRVSAPTIKVEGIEVDLSKQKGARHIFYTGIS